MTTEDFNVKDFVLKQLRHVLKDDSKEINELLAPCCQLAADALEAACPVAMGMTMVGRGDLVGIIVAIKDEREHHVVFGTSIAELSARLPSARDHLDKAPEPIRPAHIWLHILDYFEDENENTLASGVTLLVANNSAIYLSDAERVRDFQMTPVLVILIRVDSERDKIAGVSAILGLPLGLDEQLKQAGVTWSEP